jgi:hypothetical protein
LTPSNALHIVSVQAKMGAIFVPSFSNTLEEAIHHALALANERKHELATLEHLLLALVYEPDAARVMKACGVDLDVLQESLLRFVDNELEALVSDVDESEAAPTTDFQRVIQRAAIHVQTSGRTEVTGANVIVAIFTERDSLAAFFLKEQDMTRDDAVSYVSRGITAISNTSPAVNTDVKKDHLLERVALNEEFIALDNRLKELIKIREVQDLEGLMRAGLAGPRISNKKLRPILPKRDLIFPAKNVRASRTHIRKMRTPATDRSTSTDDGTGPFIFLSYARIDQPLVRDIRAMLVAQSIPVWWDQDVDPGDEWRETINARLSDASAVLTIWTKNSVGSPAVREEASHAQSGRRSVHARFDRSELPFGFAETQYLDLADWDGSSAHPVAARLIEALQIKIAPPGSKMMAQRLRRSSPIAAVVQAGRLSQIDRPEHVPPPVQSPAELAERILGLILSLDTLLGMLKSRDVFQASPCARHSLQAVRQAAVMDPLSWYGLEDSASLLKACMTDSLADDAWNGALCSGAHRVLTRVEEIRCLLQPAQVTAGYHGHPPPPLATVLQSDTPEVVDLAHTIEEAFASEEAQALVNEDLQASVARAVGQVRDAVDRPEPSRRFARLRDGLTKLAYATGAVAVAAGGGVAASMLTAPEAVAVFSQRMLAIVERLMQFFY